MRYVSTRRSSDPVDFRTAVLEGLAGDGGLFVPEHVPVLPESFRKDLPAMSFHETALAAAGLFCSPDISPGRLRMIVEEALNFPIPLIGIGPGCSVLELFHGPTLAFKDVGARFMARTMAYFAESLNREITLLVATSGDTGSAVGSAFQDVEGIRVFLLYPSGRVSRIQEQQLTTMGGCVTALEIDGTFDDCQTLVKNAFRDVPLRGELDLTSANSINISRLIPQSFYYLEAARRLGGADRQIVFSVPSGNLGNLTAGLLARRMGLPASRFIGATNVNDGFTEFLRSGTFRPKPVVPTCSNAMDVGNPSNLARIRDIYSDDLPALRKVLSAAAFTDEDTLEAIRSVHGESGYILDPHGAVGYLGLRRIFSRGIPGGAHGIVLETAHPAKFQDTVDTALGRRIALPGRLARCLELPKRSIRLSRRYPEFREFLSDSIKK